MAEIFEFQVANKGYPKAVAPPVNEAARRLSDLYFADEIDTMSRRCSGLEMAVIGANHVTDGELDGASQLANDLADGMKHLAKAFEAERRLRMAEGRLMATKQKTRKAPAAKDDPIFGAIAEHKALIRESDAPASPSPKLLCEWP